LQEIIILGAHYDTIINDKKSLIVKSEGEMPGADDNGSSVATLLMLAKLLTQMDLKKTVRIVFFDMEETGFLGSRAYVSKYKEELVNNSKLFGYINLEMLGYDSSRNDAKKRTGNMKAYIRKKGEEGHEADLKMANFLTEKGIKYAGRVRFDIEDNSFNSSDHINFWDQKIPALTFTQNWEEDFNKERYHTSNDFPETLNFSTLYNSFRFITSGVLAWNFSL